MAKRDKKNYWNLDFTCDEPHWCGTVYVKFSDFPKLAKTLVKICKDNKIDAFLEVKK